MDSVLHDAAPSLLGPSFRGSRPRFLVKRWPAGPSSQEAHGLVVEAVHGILTEFDIYLSLIQKLLESNVRISWAIVCGACIGEAEDDVLSNSNREVDQQLLDAELEGQSQASAIRFYEDEDPMDFIIPDNVGDLIEARPTVIAAPVSPISGVSVSCTLAPDESSACSFGSSSQTRSRSLCFHCRHLGPLSRSPLHSSHRAAQASSAPPAVSG